MNCEVFINSWKQVRERLGKRYITDSYIEYNSKNSIKVDRWNEDIVREMFQELSAANPSKVDLDVSQLSSIYWAKFRDKESPFAGELKECSHGLCNGFGLVVTEISRPLRNIPDYKTDCYFRCKCFMGQNHHNTIPTWEQQWYDKGYRIKQDSVFKDDAKFRNVKTFIEKSIDKIINETDIHEQN